MKGCKALSTPMVTKLHPPPNGDDLFPYLHFYCSIVGGLPFLTFTWLDSSFSVNYVAQFMHQPAIFHFQLVKRILRYVQGTIEYEVHLFMKTPLVLYGFFEADWAGCPTTCRSKKKKNKTSLLLLDQVQRRNSVL